ncbi:MAG: SCO family protein [Candidatus Porifericomitaceae bacterium WSBS_2022_MAG_OTU9]
MKRTFLLRLGLLAVVVVGTAAAGAVYRQAHEHGLLVEEGRQLSLSSPLPLPQFSVIDEAGARTSRNDIFRNRWSVVFFGYMHCPDVCTPTMRQLSQLLDSQPELSSGSPLQAVFVRIDGDDDVDYENLASYIGNFHPSVRGMNYMPPDLAAALGVWVSARGGDLYDHSTSLFVISPEAELYAVLSAPHTAANMAMVLGKVDAWYVEAS